MKKIALVTVVAIGSFVGLASSASAAPIAPPISVTPHVGVNLIDLTKNVNVSLTVTAGGTTTYIPILY